MKKHTPIYEIAKRLNAEFAEHDGWQVAHQYAGAAAEVPTLTQGAALCDQSHSGKILVEGKAAGAMLQANDLEISNRKDSDLGRIYRLRQDLFFIWTDAEKVKASADALSRQAGDSTDLITVTDVTHGNAELWLLGPSSGEVLNRLCGLDLHDSQFPDGTAKQTSVAKTTQLIIRHDLANVPAYALIGARSLAAYLWETILEAGQDLAIKPIGIAELSRSVK